MSGTKGAARADVQLPGLFIAADATSLQGQQRAKRMVATQLVLLVVAAGTGGVTMRFDSGLAPGSLVSGLAFTGALLATLVYSRGPARRRWYKGRAGAESVKTLAWRYAVGGLPFPREKPFDEESRKQVSSQFLDRCRAIVESLREIELPPARGHEQITEWMRDLRYEDLDVRMAAYRTLRLKDQRDWYFMRSRQHGRQAARWSMGSAAASIVGVTGALVHGFGVWDLDVLGVAAAVAASAAAWVQFRQDETLKLSYAVAEHELSLDLSRMETITGEGDWAEFVDNAESAISREHTMWLGRRAIT